MPGRTKYYAEGVEMSSRFMIAVAVAAALMAFQTGSCSAVDGLDASVSSASGVQVGTAAGLGHKAAGDAWFEKGDKDKAAGEYMLALDTARGSFTFSERVEMASRISWAGEYAKAEAELRLVLLEDPSNTAGRIQLARILSWAGELERALNEIETVLAPDPANTEALLVKAAVMRWKGEAAGAVGVYRNILSRKDDFDARVGLTYALLAAGDKSEAVKSRALVKASGAYQEKELASLDRALGAATKPSVDSRYSYYNDTDFNQVRRFSLIYGFWAGDVKADTRYVRVDAHDRFRDNYADSLFASGSYKYRGGRSLGLGAGVGLHRLGNRDSSGFITANIKAEEDVMGGRAGLALSNDLLTDTAALIENGVRMSSYSAYGSRPVTGRLTVYGGAGYRRYSDSNTAYDLNITPVYTVLKEGVRLSVGYKLRYLDFDRQSGSGFFDPDNFISNQVFMPASYESGRFYATIEPYFGYQSFKRYAESKSGWFGGGSLAAGYKVAGPLAIELNADGGNSAVGTAAGFKYYTAGIKAVYTQ